MLLAPNPSPYSCHVSQCNIWFMSAGYIQTVRTCEIKYAVSRLNSSLHEMHRHWRTIIIGQHQKSLDKRDTWTSCVCVCVREREREREKGSSRKRRESTNIFRSLLILRLSNSHRHSFVIHTSLTLAQNSLYTHSYTHSLSLIRPCVLSLSFSWSAENNT